jgi:putative cardiolipin synthase
MADNRAINKRTMIICMMISLFLAGCTADHLQSRPDANEYKRTSSFAIAQSVRTSIGDALAPSIKSRPQQSGFHLLTKGNDSLDMRLAMIRAAEKTLDMQYYAIHDDVTANLLLEALLRAAERGVRIRFLLDNITFDEVASSLSALDNVRNIEIRVFNPMTTGDQSLPSRITGLFTDLGKATKRMHNKVIITDNQLAVTGGRNLGDEYFDAASDVNFKDLDILAVGPIVDKMSHSFDLYWNSKEAFPVATLRPAETNPEKLAKIKKQLKDNWEKQLKTADGKKLLGSSLPLRLKNAEIPLIWAISELAADDPEKVDKPEEEVVSKPMRWMSYLASKGKKEFIAVSPYFVPQQEGVDWLAALVKRGMSVKVLTNSLASTDVVAVHTGYSRYRKDVINSGVELYEMKSTLSQRPRQRLFGASAPAQASLHSKVYIVDRKDIVIGSFNFDPRSVDLNTEIALVIHSPTLAAQLLKLINDTMLPDNSYRVLAETRKIDNKPVESLVWVTRDEGKEVRYTNDPNAGVWRNMQLFVTGLLPIEDQL